MLRTIKSSLFKGVFIAFSALATLGLQATVYQFDIYRKTITLPAGQVQYRYRIGLHDVHHDYVDGRIRKKQQAELIHVGRYLQQKNKSVHYFLEDTSHYEGDNQLLAQTLHELNQEDLNNEKIWATSESEIMHTQEGSCMRGLTELCKQNNIPCCNIEFRHARLVDGGDGLYQPNFNDALRDTRTCFNLLKNNPRFKTTFPKLYTFVEFCFKEFEKEQTPAHWKQSIMLPQCLILDGRLLNKLLQSEDENIQYVIMAFGGKHLEYVEQDHQGWQKLGYDKIASLKIPIEINGNTLKNNLDIILHQACKLNLVEFLRQHIPDLAGMPAMEPKPTASTSFAQTTLATQALHTMHALATLSDTEIDGMVNTMNSIHRYTAWSTIDAALFDAFVIRKINSTASLLTSEQYKTIITPLSAIAHEIVTKSGEINHQALQQLATNPDTIIALSNLPEHKLRELQKSLQKLLTAAQTPRIKPWNIEPTYIPAAAYTFATQHSTKPVNRKRGATKNKAKKAGKARFARTAARKKIAAKKGFKPKKTRKAGKQNRKQLKRRIRKSR